MPAVPFSCRCGTDTEVKRFAKISAFLTAIAGLGTLLLPCPAVADRPSAAAVKMTYLYKFAPFVTWPDGANDPAHFTICVVGNDPFGGDLDKAVAALTDDTRPYAIVRTDTLGPQSKCDIAYVGGSSKQTIAAALQAARGTPTLTVTDEGAPAGIVSFKMQAGKVRFRIDQVAATANSVTISSKLLSLAVSVKTAQGVVEP
jgi:hypothetical protein